MFLYLIKKKKKNWKSFSLLKSYPLSILRQKCYNILNWLRQGFLLLLLYFLKGCLKLFSDSDFEPKFRHFMMIFKKWLESDIIFSLLWNAL